MSIVQISKIQVRSGELDNLPQLSVGEFGWAVDARRLFIGNEPNTIGPIPDNTEILTVNTPNIVVGASGNSGEIQFNRDGNFSADANLRFDSGNSILTVNGDTEIYGNIRVTSDARVGAIYSDNYYDANGNPVNFQQAAGVSGHVQFNQNNEFTTDSDFTFDDFDNTLTISNGSVVTNEVFCQEIIVSDAIISQATTQTPLIINSDILVANLNSDLLDGYQSSILPVANTVVVRDANANIQIGGLTANSLDINSDSLFGGNISTTGQATLAIVETSTLTTGGNTVAGTITGNWSLTPGSRLESITADLAERYSSDYNYEPGTILMIGGTREVTIADESGRYRLAGIVSTAPAYVLNSTAENSVIVALVGRVSCRVVGKINKGDLITISNIAGVGTSVAPPAPGIVVGRALASYDSDQVGIIEIKVDR